MKKITLTILFALFATACLTSCDKDKVKGMFERRSSAEAEGNGDGSLAAPKANFIIDDDGTMRLPPPTELQKRQGAEVSTTDLAMTGSKSPRKGNNWIYDTKTKGGAFLVAAASKPGAVGGDMIRRIDLGGTIKEHDFDPDTPGKQGAYIYIPDEMKVSVPSKHIDAEGLFSGMLCAFVPGPNNTIIALGGDPDGGVAFVLNPYEDASALTPLQTIAIPHASNPCRAVYSDTLKKLYIVDVARTTSQAAQEGIFVADIYNDGRATTATYFAPKQSQRINSHSLLNFQAIELYDDILYLLSGNGRFDSDWDGVIYRVPLNRAGEPLFENLSHTRTQNPIVRQEGCPLSPTNIAALQVVEKDNKPVLLSSGTNMAVAWDISTEKLTKLDMNPKKPGVQSIALGDYGQGGPRFALDTDGKNVLLLPHCRSNSRKVKIGNDSEMFAISIMPLKLPELTPDDALDIGYRDLLLSLKDARHRPQFNMTARDFAVSPKYIGVVGAAVSGNSGLGAGADVSIIDRKKKTNIAFERPKDMRRAHELNYGFKLAQGDTRFDKYEQNSHAIIWIP